MTLRTIQWIADSGLLVGLNTIGEFAPNGLAPLSLSIVQFTLGQIASGTITGATPGSLIAVAGLPVGLTVSGTRWAYDGSGAAGTYILVLTETLFGSANSPRVTSVTVVISAPGATLDFSQSANSGELATIRSF